MVKIKTKKEMNLPELIEWAWKNEFISSVFWTSNREEGFNHKAFFDVDGNFYTSDNFNFNDTFEVKIEEEITEDTKLDLVERFIGGTGSVCYTSHSMSIKECLKRSPKECTTTHFYIENEDKELVLIWTKEKGLVE